MPVIIRREKIATLGVRSLEVKDIGFKIRLFPFLGFYSFSDFPQSQGQFPPIGSHPRLPGGVSIILENKASG